MALGAGWLIYAIPRQKAVWPVALTGFFGAGWLAMTGFTCPDLPSHHVSHFTGDTRWIITGTILDDPVPKPGHRFFFLKTDRLGNQEADFAATGNLRVKIYGEGPELLQGTVIRFTSRVRRPTSFKNPGAFDYQRYLAFKKISGLAYARADRLTVLSRPDPPASASIVETARNRLAAQIDKSASPLPAGILKALIIGKKDELPATTREVFNRVGAGHLLAISGLHIGIIATIFFLGLTKLLAFIPALTWRGSVRK
ncbi:MAG: ComEC/Rec2 family competence protein, partial [Desulfosudaceae bacterium]